MRSSEPSELDSTIYELRGLGQDTCHTQRTLLQKKNEDYNAYTSLITQSCEN